MRIVLVSTVGGHLTQLYELQRRFVRPSDDVTWITHDTAQSSSLLGDEQVVWVDYIRERDLVGVLRTVPVAWRVLRRARPELVVSTGSAIALAVLPAARALGARVCFIESAAMRVGHTRTGRILSRVPGIETFSQSVSTSGGRWRHIGSVFDGFTSERSVERVAPERVVVTVGTSQEFGFRNLLERVADIVPDGVDVLWQTGVTDLDGLGIDARPWVPEAELRNAMINADVVIAHAGGGTALSALMCERRPILVPRRANAGEFNDDHQEELTTELVAAGLAQRGSCETLTWEDVVEAARWSVSRSDLAIDLPLRPGPD